MIEKRRMKYGLLALGSIIIPFLLVIVLYFLTGSEILAVTYFVIPSIITVHFLFAYTQINVEKNWRMTMGIATAILSSLITIFYIDLGWKWNLDPYGVVDIIMVNALANILSWEILYQLNKLKIRH